MTHRPRVPYDVWRQTLPNPMSHQRAKVLTMSGRVSGAKLVFGRWMVYADATDPRCENGKRPENGPKKVRKAKK